MVLVCGGAGYIGSHTVKALRQVNEPHIVLDNLSKGHRAAVGSSPLIVGDIANQEVVQKVIEDHKVDAVMHFAASIEVGESVKTPAEYWQNNFVGTLSLLNAMRNTGVQNIIFSSTAAVYGEPALIPIPEGHVKSPTSPYGNTKRAVESMLSDFEVYGIRSVSLRYFNAAGADPDGEIGEDHDPETHLIPRIILAALGRAPDFKLFGNDYPTPDGTCLRDFVHVYDIAAAHTLALNHLRRGGDSRTYNLGHGDGYSVRQVIEAVRSVSQREFAVVERARRPGDPARLVADPTAIRHDWGWEPKYDDLESIIRHTWNWFESHPNGYDD